LQTSSEIGLAEGQAIRFTEVSKQYRLTNGEVWAGDLRNDATRWIRRVLGRPDPDAAKQVVALGGVSFAIERGETVALIGANGAGKSTCLKLISKITRPSSGELWVRGRVAALIQLGAGFHRELSGRENVYLYGSILGLTRAQLEERYDDIVGFAELEKFMDTPLKHFSSGMTVRLGFSVAIHVDADILLIDEVLAVGDAAFREKSADRLARLLSTTSTTSVMVSHDLDLLRQHCRRGIYIADGKVAIDGPVDEVIEIYKSRVTHG